MPSLTKLIKHKAFKHLRKWFTYYFPNPGMEHKPESVIATQNSSSSYSGDIGTAFDYLFRFKIEQNSQMEEETGPETWVAYKTYENLTPKYKRIVKPKFELAVKCYNEFIKDNVVNDDLFASSLFLNQLDIMYRTGYVFDDFGDDNPDKIEELRLIFENVDWTQFNLDSNYVLNPVFGGVVENVSADADLIMDKTLIELKCVKQIKLERSHLNQLISYYLLNLLKPKKEQYEIDKIGIYFARADYLWVMKLEDFYDKKELKKRAKEFEKLIVNPSSDLLPDKPGKRSVTNTLEEQETLERIKKLFDNKD